MGYWMQFGSGLAWGALPTFPCNDLMNVPNIERDLARYKQHLAEILKIG